MNSQGSPPVSRQARTALLACMFFITASMGFLQPFVPLYLEAAGLDRQQIGAVSGLAAGLAFLIQPALGYLSDILDTRRPLMSLAALFSGLAYIAYRQVQGVGAFLWLSAMGINGTFYLNAVGGVLVGRLVQGTRASGGVYAQYRVWGSVGYILVALLAGGLLNSRLTTSGGLNRATLNGVFTYGPLLFFAVALLAWWVPDPKRVPPSSHTPDLSAAPSLRPSTNVCAFLLAYFLYQFSLYGASAYLSLFLKTLGASPFGITSVFAAGVVCEVLIMTQVGRWTDLYGRRPALAVAFVLMPLRLLAYIPATTPLWVLLVQMLHGLNFGIMGAIAVVFVNDSAPPGGHGRAQARLAAVSGLATALGPAVCGWLVQHYGMKTMFATMAGFGALAAWVFLTRVRESHLEAPLRTRKAGLVSSPMFLDRLLRGEATSEADVPNKATGKTHPPEKKD